MPKRTTLRAPSEVQWPAWRRASWACSVEHGSLCFDAVESPTAAWKQPVAAFPGCQAPMPRSAFELEVWTFYTEAATTNGALQYSAPMDVAVVPTVTPVRRIDLLDQTAHMALYLPVHNIPQVRSYSLILDIAPSHTLTTVPRFRHHASIPRFGPHTT